jgi:hypothetical protein
VKVTLFDHNGSDRHAAAHFWTSTNKDADAFTMRLWTELWRRIV